MLLQVDLPSSPHIRPTKVSHATVRLLWIYTTWVTLKYTSSHRRNGLHLNHQFIWLPFKEIISTLKKWKKLKPTIPFQWHPLLQPCSNSVVLDLCLPRQPNLLMNTLKSPSANPQVCNTFTVIQGWFHSSTSKICLLHKFASRHHASIARLSIHSTSNSLL